MHVLEIWIVLFLTLVSNSLCQRIECDWTAEWLCGDKCIGEHNSCLCGHDTITSDDAHIFNCCNQETCLKGMDGNVKCRGLKQTWEFPCNGICIQGAEWGYTTILCADQTQCVKSITLCNGVPLCRE